jgi:hypothetical protein
MMVVIMVKPKVPADGEHVCVGVKLQCFIKLVELWNEMASKKNVRDGDH